MSVCASSALIVSIGRPAMQQPQAVALEGEDIAAAALLVAAAVDRPAGKMAHQQRADRAVADQ